LSILVKNKKTGKWEYDHDPTNKTTKLSILVILIIILSYIITIDDIRKESRCKRTTEYQNAYKQCILNGGEYCHLTVIEIMSNNCGNED